MDLEHSRRGAAQPEILPPGAVPIGGEAAQPRGWYPPPEYARPQPRRQRHWASAPATYTLVGINLAVYLFTLWQSQSIGGPLFYPNTLSFRLLLNGAYVFRLGQWWRVVTSMFVHFGWLHIATNMWCLWNLGLLGEPLLGELGMVAAYVLTGAAGNLLSIAIHPGPPGQGGYLSAGASGAVFGIAGVLLMLLRSPLLPIPQAELKKLRRSVWYFALLNFVVDFGLLAVHTRIQSVPQIDNMAHLGGFVGGILLGVPLLPRIGAPRANFLRRRAVVMATAAFVLVLFAWWLHAVYPPLSS
jgi:rhomboid protease GluP